MTPQLASQISNQVPTFAFLFALAVLLSSVDGNLHTVTDSQFRDHFIVAAFKIGKPVSVVKNNVLQLQDDIFDEIGVPNTKVEVMSLIPYGGSSITKIVFGVDPNVKGSKLSSVTKSLIRASFESLVMHQSSLRLTTSLFGEPSSFDVLKFVGGITIIPPQNAFVLQQVQILFNFSLNLSIDELQVKFSKLTGQLKPGLHLAPNENLFVSLSNSKGSTVVPPTIVQSSVLNSAGNTPSTGRLKQLARTITGLHNKNLGLNDGVFGKVKQVSLSAILKHYSPSPTPLPKRHNHDKHQHYHDRAPSPNHL